MNIDIRAEERIIGKKSDLNVMRKEGLIPCIIYSSGKESIPIKLEKNSFLKQYNKTIGELVLFNILIGDNKYQTVIKDKQIDPVSRDIIHMDFLEIKADTKITVNVPIKYVGTPVGIKNGGILDIIIREVQITCLPKHLTEDVEIDISNLDVGDSIHAGSIMIDNVDIHLASDMTIVIVHPPKLVVDVEEAQLTEETVPEEPKDTE